MSGGLLVLAAPSGTGKTTVARSLVGGGGPYRFSVSATTRRARGDEVDGRDYHFVGDEEFDRLVAEDQFLEWAPVHGCRYGTLVAEVERIAAEGCYAVLDIDVQGALQVRERAREAILIFLLPPSGGELVRRLTGRGTDRGAEVKARLRTAQEELELAEQFDYCVVNTELAETVEDVRRIVRAEGQRVGRIGNFGEMVARLKAEIAEGARDLAL